MLVVGVHHDRRMDGNVDAHLVNELEYGKILDEQCVRLYLIEVGEIRAQGGNLFVADEIVQSDVETDIVCMGIGNCFF